MTKKEVCQLATHSLLLAFLVVSLFCGLGYFTINPLFTFMGAEDQTMHLINDYMTVCYFGLPFLVIPIVSNIIIRTSGESLIPSVIMVFTAIVNVILDPILIFGYSSMPEIGIKGAAVASVTARIYTFVFSSFILIFKEKLLKLKNFSISNVLSSLGITLIFCSF